MTEQSQTIRKRLEMIHLHFDGRIQEGESDMELIIDLLESLCESVEILKDHTHSIV